MRLGVDLSTYEELHCFSPHYYHDGIEVEPFEFFSKHCRIQTLRLRLWVDPYDEQGRPYGGGTNDFATTLKLAKKAKENGMDLLLDFHYSDFYVDPSRQRLPKAWEKKSFLEVIKEVKEYTRLTLLSLKDEGIEVMGVQVGNEVSNGMIYPFGALWGEEGGGFEGFAALFNAGCDAVKEVYPSAKVICHLEHSASFDMQFHFFDSFLKAGGRFDVIGESYYPYWHGSLRQLKDCLERLKEIFRKEIWLVEVGYEYSESRLEGHHSEFDADDPDFEVGNIDGKVPFPLTKKGQADYLDALLRLGKEIGVGLICYWEPAWIECKGNGWAKEAGMAYCGLEIGVAENDWANETLFDFDGNSNEAVEIFNQEYVDKL